MSTETTRRRVLAFDIGIKNLAWCVVEKDADGKTFRILGWDNYNLLEEESAESVAVPCGMCKAKAIYMCNKAGEDAAPRCGRHVPAGFQVFKGFTLPASYFTDNLNKPAYRVRPRFNSEYVWNLDQLKLFGGDKADYHTYEQWFSKP
jgi:hypothetical protein